jgi:hypothetical protein
MKFKSLLKKSCDKRMKSKQSNGAPLYLLGHLGNLEIEVEAELAYRPCGKTGTIRT